MKLHKKTIEELYKLYKDGRQNKKAPHGYIDYFETRNFINQHTIDPLILREQIESVPTEYPEYESDDYDRGLKYMKEKILSLLPEKEV